MPPNLRKTRIVCVSDTHNASPTDGAFKLPKGDVLIHAGDLTKQGTFQELRKTLDWIEQADFEVKIVIAGNHDITLDSDFYTEHGLYFHNQHPQDSEACIRLLKECKSIHYLNHEATTIRLTKNGGPKTTFKLFGSPYSPKNGLWAFGYPPERASELWDQIPLDTDILITHGPPRYHCDESRDHAAGCEFLRQTMWRVRPSLAICGHVHEGRGAERVLWDLESPNITNREFATGYWEDPGNGNKKQSLVELDSRAAEPLRNAGSWAGRTEEVEGEKLVATCTTTSRTSKENSTLMTQASYETCWERNDNICRLGDVHSAVRGQGGISSPGRCDMEALAGRRNRQETCIVNAAIMASSWPYKSDRKAKYNKPIIVNIDLPVWQDKE